MTFHKFDPYECLSKAEGDPAKAANPAKVDALHPINESRLSLAQSLLVTCQRHGVALHIDDRGDLVIGRASAKANEDSQPWASLVIALEANLEEVARLVAAGWQLRAEFPTECDVKESS